MAANVGPKSTISRSNRQHGSIAVGIKERDQRLHPDPRRCKKQAEPAGGLTEQICDRRSCHVNDCPDDVLRRLPK